MTTDLARELYSLAVRVQSGDLRPWQVRRIASALAPELALLARCDAHDDGGHALRCQVCGETYPELGMLADHGRDAHRLDLAGRRMLASVRA